MVTGYSTFSIHVPLELDNYDPLNHQTYLDVTGALIRHEYLDRRDKSFFWLAGLEVLYRGVDLMPLEKAAIVQLDIVEAFILPRAEDIFNGTIANDYCFRKVEVPVTVKSMTDSILLRDEYQDCYNVQYDYRTIFFDLGLSNQRWCLSIDEVRENDIDIFSVESPLDEQDKKWIYHEHLVKKATRLMHELPEMKAALALSI